MQQISREQIPRVLISSYEWAQISGVFVGSLETYLELQYTAYCFMAYKYDIQPKKMVEWLAAYGSAKNAH